jgi:flagellar protein FliL
MTVTEMPPEAEADAGEAPAEAKKGKKKGKKEKGGKSNLVPAVVLAVGIAAGGYFMGGSGGAEPAVAEAVEPEIVEGPLLGVEALTVNLADGHYLRVAVSLQLTDQYEDVEVGEHGEELLSHHDDTRIRDVLISLLGGRDASELSSAEGRDHARHELHEAANGLLDDAVMEIYFTEFVIQ